MVGKTRKEVTSYEGKEAFSRRTLSRGLQNGIGVFSDRGEQQIGWVLGKYQATMGAVGKACHLPNFHAKIDSTITKYIGHNFTKVTTFITIIVKNNYKNCYLEEIISKGSLV